jgi:hypothetical protein
MELYTNVLNKGKIYDTLFLKIFTVSEYSDAHQFKLADQDMYDAWCKKNDDDENYLNNTALSPEFGKIVGVSLCTVTDNDGEMKRNFHNIYNAKDELEVLDFLFQTIQSAESTIGNPLLCGHNILGYDIPFIIKRALKNQIEIPQLFKKIINSKPWESVAIDTMLLWKFGSFEYTSLNEITTFLGLKYKTLPMDELDMNTKFHKEGGVNNQWFEKETMNRVNLTLQLMNKLRSM